MGWEQRDYWQESQGARRVDWRALTPRGGTLALLVLHTAGFLSTVFFFAQVGQRAAALLLLGAGPDSLARPHPLAILLHPLASPDLLAFVLTALVIWMLGGRIEIALGARALLAHYVAGNLLAGLAYFLVAQASPPLALAPLYTPIGAMAAWCVLLGRRLPYDVVDFFGRVVPLWKMTAILAAVAVALKLISAKLGAGAWLAAVAASAAAPYAVELLTSLRGRFRARLRRPLRGAPRVRPRPTPPADEPPIDDILAKISRQGIQSLTPTERARLEAARRVKLGGASASAKRRA